MFGSLSWTPYRLVFGCATLSLGLLRKAPKVAKPVRAALRFRARYLAISPNLVRVGSLKTDGLLLGRFAAEDV